MLSTCAKLRTSAGVALVCGSLVLGACGRFSAEVSPQIEIAPAALGTTTTVAPLENESPASTYRPTLALAEGSGCNPSESEGLPTGRWFGYLIETRSGTITFDLACYFGGSQAKAAAAEDGATVVDGEPYIRNVLADRRVITTNPGISINVFDDSGDDVQSGEFYPQWFLRAPNDIPVWITMDPSRVRSITLAS